MNHQPKRLTLRRIVKGEVDIQEYYIVCDMDHPPVLDVPGLIEGDVRDKLVREAGELFGKLQKGARQDARNTVE